MTALVITGGFIAAGIMAEWIAPKLSFMAHLINDTLILWEIE